MNKNKLILNACDLLPMLDKKTIKLLSVFNDKFGIVNAILERHELDKYNLYMYQCLSANTTQLFNLNRDVSSGGLGVNKNKNKAIVGCLAEALERYCMSYVPKNQLIISKKKNLPLKFTFEDFALYSKTQYNENEKFANPNVDLIEWTKIYNFEKKGEYKLWPASLIYLPYDYGKNVAETTSTGMAAGFTMSDCIKSGLLELIERDALMINFMQRLNPPEIDIKTIDGNNKKFVNLIEKEYKIKIYRLYSDINIPIYLSIIYNGRGNKTHYGIGACASLDSDWAINKSLKECLFTYFYSNNLMKEKQKKAEKIKTLYEHFLYYQGSNFNKLLFNSKIIEYKKEKIAFEQLVNELKEKNMNIYYKDLTTNDIKSTGLKVVRVIVPGLIDLNKSHIYPRLAAKRFFEVPKDLGLRYENDLTSLPHPFP